ncbi:hypothetical protein ACH5RR_015864 [Cinchona calisaya]|uniref:Cytochrome P450 n=1 Tax=Cinchona calisaya TaxID=153742 RepID=A0ABD2ZXF7_9GENT
MATNSSASSGDLNPFIISLFLLLPILWIILKQYNRNKSLPPGPKAWPIIGNLAQLGANLHRDLAQLAQVYGPVMSLRLGSQLLVVGSTPEAAVEILKTHDRLFSGRHVGHISYAKSPHMNHVSLAWSSDCTQQWKLLRTLCRSEMFSWKMIENQSYLREKKLNELIEFLVSKEGEKIKIAQFVFASIFNFLGNILCSKDLVSFEEVEADSGLRRNMREIVELYASPNISDFYPILSRLDLQGLKKKVDECVKIVHGAWEGILRDKRAKKAFRDSSNNNKDLMDVLLDNEFSDDQINYLFLELFIAGSDTTSSTIEWAMTELIKKPECMKTIRQELEREISGNIIKESDLSRLSYLNACVKETLRLHPPTPLLLPRRASEACQIMNYTIPKGTQVVVNVWTIATNPNIWEEPLTFNPDRFLHTELDFIGNDFELLPFGAGRRMCPGLNLGIRQVHFILASLIHHFEWSLPDNMLLHQLDMNEKFGVTVQKEQPLVIVMKQRK